ncbi:MAG: DUF4913 domain-containing protein [Microbacterium sp.]|uniref:DUF4913 domain-containing protein n=1 Tax=Microbacterium sp. TaxID=51671 RepID=UPI003F969625
MSDNKTVEPDAHAVAQAAAAVEAATQAIADAEAKVAAAVDVLADATDDIAVAETKVEDFLSLDSKLPWQVAAVQRDLAKRKRAQARAEGKHASATAAVDAARDDLNAARAALAQARVTPARPLPDDAGVPPAASKEVIAWVEKLTNYLESQERGDSLWCPQWEEHSEAVWRFTALHREFEISFLDDTMSGWWVNHFDRHAPFIFGATGIFQSCENGHDPDRSFRFSRRA